MIESILKFREFTYGLNPMTAFTRVVWKIIYDNKDNLKPQHIEMFMSLFVKIWKKVSNGNVIGIGFPVKYVPGAYYSPQEYQVEIYTPFSEALYLNQI